MLPTLAASFDKVFGIDLYTSEAKKVVDYYKLGNVEIIQANILRLPFRDDYFEVIFAASIFEHLLNLQEALIEIKRVLASKGLLIFCSPTESWLYHLGRKILGYKKPQDHYHSADRIVKEIRSVFNIDIIKCCPIPVLSTFAIYKLVRAQKM